MLASAMAAVMTTVIVARVTGVVAMKASQYW